MKKIFFLTVLSCIGLTTVTSAATPMLAAPNQPATQTRQAVITNDQWEEDRVDPYGPIYGSVKYVFDKDKVISYYKTNIPKMYRLRCNKTAILKMLGFDNSKIFSIGLNEWEYQVSYDLNSCNVWMNWIGSGVESTNDLSVSAKYLPYPNPNTNPIDEKLSMEKAKKFLSENKVFDIIEKNLGTPFIKWRGYTDETNKQVGIISVFFPFIINDRPVYYQYGEQAWVSIDVNSNGVSNANINILSIILSRASSVINPSDDIINMIERWGNNMFYPASPSNNEFKVNLSSPIKIWVLVQRYNGVSPIPSSYLVSGIKMTSDQKTYKGGPDYEMTISDYKLGNNNNGGPVWPMY